MAKPIKETPFLKGRDAQDFMKRSASPKVLVPSTKKRIDANYKALKAILAK